MAAYEGGARRRPPPPLRKPRAALLALAQQDAEHYLRGAGADGLAEAIRAVAVAAIEEIADETRDPRASSTGAPAAKVSAGAAGAHARVARAQAERIAARDALADDDPLSSALLRAVADEMPAPATAPPAPGAGLRRGPGARLGAGDAEPAAVGRRARRADGGDPFSQRLRCARLWRAPCSRDTTRFSSLILVPSTPS